MTATSRRNRELAYLRRVAPHEYELAVAMPSDIVEVLAVKNGFRSKEHNPWHIHNKRLGK